MSKALDRVRAERDDALSELDHLRAVNQSLIAKLFETTDADEESHG